MEVAPPARIPANKVVVRVRAADSQALSGKTVRVALMVVLMKSGCSGARWAALSCALGGAFSCASAAAQTTENAAVLQQVVVTASRFARPIADVLADVTVIDRQQIEESGASSVLQILELQHGLQVGGAKVYVRGGEARMTGLFVDGVRVGGQDGNQLGGGVNWELLPLGDIERIEIVRGPASVLYGADAMTGVVQIFTRKGEEGVHPFISLGAGSYNTQKIAAGVRGAAASLDYALYVASSQTDGFNTYKGVAHTPETEGAKNTDASLRLGYWVNDAQRLEWSSSQNRLQYRSVDVYGANNFEDTTTSGTLQTSAASWSARWSDHLKTTVRLSRSLVAYTSNTDPLWDYFTVLEGLSLDAQWQGLGGLWSPFLEQKRDTFKAAENAYNTAVNGSRTVNAAGLGYGTRIGASELQVSTRRDDDSIYGGNATGAVSYAYLLTPSVRVGASAGTSYRTPTMEQLLGEYGSATLAPESGRSNELSAAYVQGGSELRLVYYRNSYHQLISSSMSSAACAAGYFCWYNVDTASVEGATLSGARRMGGVRLQGSVDVLTPRNETTGKDLSLRARQVIVLGVEMPWNSWTLGAEVQDVGATFDDAANSTVNRGYTLLNLRAQRSLGKDWKLVLRVNNATDQTYQKMSGYSTPGANFFATLQWSPQQD